MMVVLRTISGRISPHCLCLCFVNGGKNATFRQFITQLRAKNNVFFFPQIDECNLCEKFFG